MTHQLSIHNTLAGPKIGADQLVEGDGDASGSQSRARLAPAFREPQRARVRHLIEPALSDDAIAALRAAAEKATAEYQIENDRLCKLRAERDNIRKRLEPRPDIEAALAAAKEAEVRARFLGGSGAKEAIKALAAAHDALEADVTSRRAADVELPVIEQLVKEQQTKVTALKMKSDIAGDKLGAAVGNRIVADEVVPLLERAVVALKRAQSAAEEHGASVDFGIEIKRWRGDRCGFEARELAD